MIALGHIGEEPDPQNHNSEMPESIMMLLDAGHYDRAVSLLQEAQHLYEGRGESSIAASLSAIRQVCIACSRFQAEKDWYDRAQQEANERELELKRLISKQLDLLRNDPRLTIPPSNPAKLRTEAPTAVSPPAEKEKSPVRKTDQAGFSSTPVMKVNCLGPFRVYILDRLITPWQSHKSLLILKFLIKHYGTPISKEILMDTFWPNTDPETARPNLHQAIYSLRQTLRRGGEHVQSIVFEHDCYLINPNLPVWVDTIEFEHHLRAAQKLEIAGSVQEAMERYQLAEALYVGDFLEEDVFEEWASLPREKFRHAYFDIADRLSQHLQDQGEFHAAIEMCQKILDKDSCHEGAHYRMMQCYRSLGRRSCAARQYQMCVKALKAGLDALPSTSTTTLFQEIVHNG